LAERGDIHVRATSRRGPLEGIRVIDASTILAGPLCCQILGDHGADVIKIEHPSHGDGMRGHGRERGGEGLWWKELSRNKRTVGLRLDDSRGAVVFRRLVRTADVVVENFRPGTLEQWGIGPGDLHAVNPRLVLVRVSGFGQRGPYARRRGFGTIAEAMSGFAGLTGSPEGPPTLPPFGLADSICGIAAASATAMALYDRDARGGTGQEIDLSILESMMAALPPVVTVYDQLGVIEQRHGNRSTNNAPRNTYLTKDDRWVAISASAQRIAERVMCLIGRSEMVDEGWFGSGRGRAEHVDEIDKAVGAWIRDRTRAEVLETFEEAGAAIAPIYDARDIAEDPQVQALDLITTVKDETLGPLKMRNVLGRMSGTPGTIRFTGRSLGADTHEILGGELGMDAVELDALEEDGVIT
jgi:crotonobetainyl-CoA:carnitine CoA-transferase CaiB-like acyl-CoA transferase